MYLNFFKVKSFSLFFCGGHKTYVVIFGVKYLHPVVGAKNQCSKYVLLYPCLLKRRKEPNMYFTFTHPPPKKKNKVKEESFTPKNT